MLIDFRVNEHMLILNESDYMYLKHEGFILIDDSLSFLDEQYIITKCIQNDEFIKNTEMDIYHCYNYNFQKFSFVRKNVGLGNYKQAKPRKDQNIVSAIDKMVSNFRDHGLMNPDYKTANEYFNAKIIEEKKSRSSGYK